MAITWANILNWESGSLESIAKDLLEANQVLRKAYEDGEDALGAVRSEGEAVTAMRATTLTNLASLERALTNVNGALLAIEGARDGLRPSCHSSTPHLHSLRKMTAPFIPTAASPAKAPRIDAESLPSHWRSSAT